MAENKGLRRFDRCRTLRSGQGHAGHQSGMPDSIPLQQRNRPASHRNAVRHHSGILSAISPESCPSWRGTRTPDSPLICPRVSSQFDYEGEIAIIIGKGGRHIEMDQAADHIFGYSLFNDASVRDFQQGHSLAAGKNFHRTGAFGPSILLAAAVRDARSLSFTTSVNGERRQSASLSDLLFDLSYLISYISRITPLLPGNVILTGTPQGVGVSRVPPIWLKPGDIIEVASPDIGTLRNSVVAEAV